MMYAQKNAWWLPAEPVQWKVYKDGVPAGEVWARDTQEALQLKAMEVNGLKRIRNVLTGKGTLGAKYSFRRA